MGGSYANTMFNFVKTAKLSSSWLFHFTFLPAMNESSCGLHPWQHLVLSGVLDLAILVGVQW